MEVDRDLRNAFAGLCKSIPLNLNKGGANYAIRQDPFFFQKLCDILRYYMISCENYTMLFLVYGLRKKSDPTTQKYSTSLSILNAHTKICNYTTLAISFTGIFMVMDLTHWCYFGVAVSGATKKNSVFLMMVGKKWIWNPSVVCVKRLLKNMPQKNRINFPSFLSDPSTSWALHFFWKKNHFFPRRKIGSHPLLNDFFYRFFFAEKTSFDTLSFLLKK